MGNTQSLDKEIKKLEGKAEIDLSRREIKSLPPSVSRLKAAVKLNISENEITEIPLEIGFL